MSSLTDNGTQQEKVSMLILNDRDLSSGFGGQASFIKNLDPWLRQKFALTYVTLQSVWLKQKLVPLRLAYLIRVFLFLIRHRHNFDIVLSHTPEASYAVSFFRIPFMHIFHGNLNPVIMSTFWYGKYFRRLFGHFEARIIKKAGHLFTVGEFRPEAEKLFNPVSIDMPGLAGTVRKDFIYAGRLETVKNVDKIIELYSQLPADIKAQNKLNIIGTGSQEKHLQKLVYNLDLNNNVAFHGLTDNDTAIRMIANSRILIIASSSEGFPMVIAESLTCGTPVIATDVGDIRSVLKDGYNGFLLESAYSSVDFSEKVRVILANYNTFSFNSIQSARIFDAKVSANSLISACKKLIRSH